ncbi:MAG: helix-turn-helix domain-containing protein, partial [Clostridia bacterium]
FDDASLRDSANQEELSAAASALLAQIQDFQRTSALGLESLTIQKAKEFVQKHYMHDIMLEDVANHVNLSSFYFSKFFKTKTGSSLTDYIISVRMKAATELFKSGQYKIYEISEMCGYQSRKYFSHAFKQYTGYTPSEYQRMLNLNTRGSGDEDA